MLSVIENVCVERKGWITHDEMMYITVIAESTPGPVAINCATFVGCRRKGFWGAAAATAGVVLPSLVIISLIALFFDRLLEVPLVAAAFSGIKAGVGVLILGVGLKMAKKAWKTPLLKAVGIAAALAMAAISVFSVRFSSVLLMLLGGVAAWIGYVSSRADHEEVPK